jgi:phenylalanyl-tRNA synthetase beta chain
LKVTLNWLKEFVDISLPPEKLADVLTMAGLEVEEVQYVKHQFSKVVVAKIIDCEKMTDADHLFYCKVDIGDAVLPLVCGAPNVFKGLLAPLALVGAQLPGGLNVDVREIRGIESQGMLCSEAELGLSERSEQLLELPQDNIPGTDINNVLGEPDVVFDIAITPNRPDCLSVFGIAREIAALTGETLKRPNIIINPVEKNVNDYINVDIENSDHCLRYSGRYLENVKIAPSPFWMAQRLFAVGVRSINNIVDITNYVMMEVGQPLHAFDYSLLQDQKIIVRSAKSGESFTTLDGKNHELDKESLLICDGEKPVALAGVMGGLNSEVQPNTNRVFLESAYFETTNIRKTSKKLDLSTESSRRFERGTDPNGTVAAMDRATQLMCQFANAKVIGTKVDNYAKTVENKQIALSAENTNKLLGTTFNSSKIEILLKLIELKNVADSGEKLLLDVPTFRPDLEREVDLIEEVARLYGYNNVPTELAPKINQLSQQNAKVQFKEKIQHLLRSLGLYETLNLSLVDKKFGKPFLPDNTSLVTLLNPLSEDLTVFRPNLILSLLNTVSYNRNRQMHNMQLYEIGNIAWTNSEGLKTEKSFIAGILAGQRNESTWYGNTEQYDFYDVKGFVTAILSNLNVTSFSFASTEESYWDQESASVKINDKIVGTFGKLSDEIIGLFKIKTNDIHAFYLDFELLYEYQKVDKYFAEIPKYPFTPFDLALIVDAEVPVGEIENIIWKNGGQLLIDVQLFDYYKGKQVETGKKSIAFSLTFSSKERTLDDKEIETVIGSILAKLNKNFGAELRQG